jgi:hypothetical protein
MSSAKSKKSSRAKKSSPGSSLITPETQRAIYQAVRSLPSSRKAARGAEIAEVAVCLAAGNTVPVIQAGATPGVRAIRKDAIRPRATGGRFTAATLAAVEAMLHRPDAAAALICAGALDAGPKEQKDARNAFRFAATHRLPLLFVVANRLGARSSKQLDLRSLYPEFGMHVFTVDANDAIAAYRVTTEAMHYIRQRRGPSILEALSVPAALNGQAHSPLELLAAYMQRHGCPAL